MGKITGAVCIAKRCALILLLPISMAVSATAGNRSTAPRLHHISNRTIMSKSSDYADKYAAAAMEQMRRYGIPASVTLAQGILESASGQSELSRKGNNHFGIKATQSWVQNGGQYLVYTDDKPNERFCRYASVSDSYEHHSLFLKSNSRYASLFKLSPDDYVGWTKGLQRAGYATSNSYAASLQSVIRSHGLDKYDRMVMQEQGWQSTMSKGTSTAELARNSQEAATDSTTQKQEAPATEQKSEEKEKPQEKNYFNSIFADNTQNDPWKNLFGSESAWHYGSDPIVEMASTMFAGTPSYPTPTCTGSSESGRRATSTRRARATCSRWS